jgi:fused signal recognition particle receptor
VGEKEGRTHLAGGETDAVTKPEVVLVVGVNGAGKTTTVGKLAYLWSKEGKKVMVAASDTFRAAATEQLEGWVQRAGGEIVRQDRGADPAAVAFDAYQAAKARGCDRLLVDTAGRLHTKANLMEELKKIKRVLGRQAPGAPHRVLLVLDATAGQNALIQAREFGEATGVTGIVMAKLDGTARGGAVIAIARELKVPVEMLGVGEGPEDLIDFIPEDFVDALLAP